MARQRREKSPLTLGFLANHELQEAESRFLHYKNQLVNHFLLWSWKSRVQYLDPASSRSESSRAS